MQQDRAHAFALEQVIKIDRECTDEFVSARKNRILDRPEMNQIAQEIREGKVSRILVYKRDRLARNAIEYMELYRLFRKHHVEILFTAKNEFPMYFTPLGEFIELIMSGLVEHEAEQIAERLIATRLANFVSGNNAGGNLPYGLHEILGEDDKADVDFKSDTFRQEIKEIFALAIACAKRGGTLSELVTTMEAQGYLRLPAEHKNNRKKIAPWSDKELQTLLTNPIYMGLQRKNFGGIRKEKERPRCEVVSKEDWGDIQVWIEPFQARKSEEPDYDFMLEGLMICKKCKRTLVGSFHKQGSDLYPTYDCRQNKKMREKNPSGHANYHVQAECCHTEVLKVVKEHVEALIKSNTKTVVNADRNRKRVALLKKVKETKERIRELEVEFMHCMSTQLVNSGDFSREALFEPPKAIRDELERKREDLRKDEKELRDYGVLPHIYSSREKALKKLWAMIKDPETRQMKDLLADIVDKIIVSPGAIDIHLKHPFVMSEEGEIVIGLEKFHQE